MDDANNNPIGADLDWLAFQYVAGELSHIERESFEARLAIDQTAREAVAAAVELSSACREAFAADLVRPTPVTSRSSALTRQSTRQTARRFAVLAAVLAACLAIAWLGRFRGGGSDPGLAVRDANDRGASAVGSESLWGDRGGRAQQLALVWADLNEQFLPEEAPPRDATSDSSEFNSLAVSTVITQDDDVDLAAPDWLIAALDDDATTDSTGDEG